MTTAVSKPTDEPLAPVPTAPRTRRRRWLRRLLVVLLMLVAVWLWLVPPLAASLLTSSLQSAGLRDVQVETVAVGFGRLHARSLRLGRDGVGDVLIPEAIAEFSLGDLWAGRVASLTLVGLTWTMAAGCASSPFDEVLRRAGKPPRTALPELPLQRLTIRAGRIVPPPERPAPVVAFDAEINVVDGRWDVKARAAGGGQGAQLTAQLDVAPARASGPVTLRAAGERPLELRGTLRCEVVGAGRVLDIELRRVAGPFDVQVANATWSGDGALMLRAHVPLADLAAATFDVVLDGVSLAGSNGFSLAGLAAAMRLTGLPVPTSPGPQQVHWRSAQLAALAVGEGNAEIDLQPDLQLRARIEQKTADGAGTITFSGLRYTPGAGGVPAHVVFDRVPLQEWLEALSKGRITGEGRLNGDVDMVLAWAPRLDVELQGGHLSSESGVVHFLDDDETKGMIRHHVEQIAAATGHDNMVKERLVGALEEFAYDTLDFRIEPEPDGKGVTLCVHTAGKGRIVPQELDLTVNLHGFDAAVDTALAIKLGLDRAKQRLDDKIENKDAEPEPQQERR